MTPAPSRVRATFQTKFFLAALSAAVLALAVAGVLFATTMRRQIDERIETTLVAEARLAADLLGARRRAPAHRSPELDEEADRIGELLGARVTFIAADGRVVGDSAETLEGVAAMENHAQRPEVVEARARPASARARRYSDTLKIDMLYVAVPVAASGDRVRARRAAAHRRPPAAAAGADRDARPRSASRCVGGAAIAWIVLRAHRPARAAHRRRRRALPARRPDAAAPRLRRRRARRRWRGRWTTRCRRSAAGSREQARDRARMEAILAGMVEGVIVVDPQGRLQLVNDAARQMLKLDELGDRAAVRRDDPASGDRRAGGRRARSAATPDALQLSPPRDPSRTIMARAAPAAGAAAHGVDPRAARHHRAAARRSDPARLRRQRLARAAHAADGDSRLRRGALGGRRRAPDERRRFLEIIARHTQRMERLVKDLLRLARLDAGQETLDLVACDTRGLVARRRRRPGAGGSTRAASAIEVAIAPGAETVRADPAKLHDALRNLVANAITYAPEQTTIRIDAARDGDRVAIAVSDEGPGHSRRGSVARVRALLPRRQVARARSRRHRPRARDREASGRAARRRGAGGEPARTAARGSRSPAR